MYWPDTDEAAEEQLVAWQALRLRPGGRSFFIGTEDYVGNCREVAAARAAASRSRTRGFSPYVADASAGQKVICDWAF